MPDALPMGRRPFSPPREVKVPTHDSPDFSALMAEAHRVTVALDGFSRHEGSKAVVEALRDGRRVYEQLHEYLETVRMTPTETSSPGIALDMLRARLLFLGEAG
jgi:hypothetical protein